jgi:hypothetical protein
MRSGAKFTKAMADNRRCPWPRGEGFCLALLPGATTYSSAAYLLSNIGLILLSPAVVYTAQILIVPGIVAFARKIASENREKMKQPAVVGIDGRWNHRINGSGHIPDIVDVESRSVVDFEIVQRTNASGRGNYEGSSNGMEVEAKKRMVKRWENDQKVLVVVTDRYCQEIPKEERQLLYELGRRSRNWFNHAVHQPIARDKKIEMWENAFNHSCNDHSKCDHPAHQG